MKKCEKKWKNFWQISDKFLNHVLMKIIDFIKNQLVFKAKSIIQKFYIFENFWQISESWLPNRPQTDPKLTPNSPLSRPLPAHQQTLATP